MTSRRTALLRERVFLFLRVTCISGGVGAVYGLVTARSAGTAAASMLIGAIHGLLIAGSIGGLEVFVLREGAAQRLLARLPFGAVVLLKTLLYAALITAEILYVPLVTRLLDPSALPPLEGHARWVAVGFSLAMTLVIVVLMQAAALVGRRTFRNLVLGRYRQPRAERRFFLFVDVMGSTGIAERLGPLQAHRFLAAVFSITAEPVAASHGEIYQYVGDEIVVTWPEDEGRVDGRPLRCYFDMQAALDAAAGDFRARFGVDPSLRAALHLGEVIAGEVGEQRRAIVYHGDVMNTAARLENATREAGVRFIASADALASIGPVPGIEARDLGPLALRGRSEPIRASAVAAAA